MHPIKPTPCHRCGTPWRFGLECEAYECREAGWVASSTEWPVTLGLAIRAFVRRAEVDGLTAAVYGSALVMLHYSGSDAGDGAAATMRAALDRLAALAKGDR